MSDTPTPTGGQALGPIEARLYDDLCGDCFERAKAALADTLAENAALREERDDLKERLAGYEETRYSEADLKTWWPTKCKKCGWQGLSRDCSGGGAIADTGDYDDPMCPKCYGEVEDDTQGFPPGCEPVELLREQRAELARLREENARLNKEMESAAPERCPITGLLFFMTIEDEDGRMVPTYGGPYDSYTIPEIDDEKGLPLHERELTRRRYDHDEGAWREGCEIVSQRLIEEEDLMRFDDLKDQLSTLRATNAGLVDALEGARHHVQAMIEMAPDTYMSLPGSIEEIDAALDAAKQTQPERSGE